MASALLVGITPNSSFIETEYTLRVNSWSVQYKQLTIIPLYAVWGLKGNILVEAYLNNHKINELESLHVEMHTGE